MNDSWKARAVDGELVVENGEVTGLRFDDGSAQFDGRYEK